MWKPSTDFLLPVLVCPHNGTMLGDVVVVPRDVPLLRDITVTCGVFVTLTSREIMTARVIAKRRLTFPAKVSGKMCPLK